MMATVRILPEVILPDSLYECRSLSLDKHRLGKAGDSLASAKNRLYNGQYSIPYSVWPSWVHRSYDLQLAGQRVRRAMKQTVMRTSSHSSCFASLEPVDQSYMMVQNLPLDDTQRLQLLGINSVAQRMRAGLFLLLSCENLCCRHCERIVARQADIFTMPSLEGPKEERKNDEDQHCSPMDYMDEIMHIRDPPEGEPGGLSVPDAEVVSSNCYPGLVLVRILKLSGI